MLALLLLAVAMRLELGWAPSTWRVSARCTAKPLAAQLASQPTSASSHAQRRRWRSRPTASATLKERQARRGLKSRGEQDAPGPGFKAVEGSSPRPPKCDSNTLRARLSLGVVEKLLGIVRSGDMDAARQAFNDKATRDANCRPLIALTTCGSRRGRCWPAPKLPPRLHTYSRSIGLVSAAGNWWPSLSARPLMQHRRFRVGYASRRSRPSLAEGDLWQDIVPWPRRAEVTCSLLLEAMQSALSNVVAPCAAAMPHRGLQRCLRRLPRATRT